jgi:hypothetical protein
VGISVGEPIPPPPWFKENVALGVLPRNWKDNYPEHRCRCGHVQGAHPADGACLAKPCRKRSRCAKYDEDARFLLPEYGSKVNGEAVITPLPEVTPAPPSGEAPG